MRQFNEEVQFSQLVTFLTLPVEFNGKFVDGDTTPSVLNVRVWKCSGGAVVTVTDFDDGAENQTILVLGDGVTTIANNANIKTNTGADKLLATDRLYLFVNIDGVWYEH